MSCLRRGASLLLLACLCALPPSAAGAQDPTSSTSRLVVLELTPTDRAQMAVWIEKADGTFMRTVRLTEAVAYRGIGNRPGATQMNTGFRYPYGRRQGALPVWAHRRHEASGAKFPRVIFWGRESTDGVHSGEGYASIHGDPGGSNTLDNHFCLSFTDENNALDAVTCASPFLSNKGRYVSSEDVESGYAAQPWQRPDGSDHWRELSQGSLYPPRRDIPPCSGECSDHPDVFEYASDAREVMPHIDAVTMATPPGNEPQTIRFKVPDDWPDGEYVAFVEVNVEADYNEHYNPETQPEPQPDPPDRRDAYWDTWAHTKGVSSAGQPSVVYRVPFTLTPVGGEFADMEVAGYGAVRGQDGEMRAMDGTITFDPEEAPGSGADRLRATADGPRLRVEVVPTAVCSRPEPPEACGRPCSPAEQCPGGLICGPDGRCTGLCDAAMPPPPVEELVVEPHPDSKQSHHFAHLRFRVPEARRPVGEYRVRFRPSRPIDDEQSFMRAEEAKRANIEGERLELPTDVSSGGLVESDFGILKPQTRYSVAVRVVDVCGQAGPIRTDEVTTTEVEYTTVSPCFVATAAHGSPMADEVRVLRRLRDRHLRNSGIGRALVDAYYAAGEPAAALLREHEGLRALARAALSPLVTLAKLLD